MKDIIKGLEKEKNDLNRRFEKFEMSRSEHELELIRIDDRIAYEKDSIKKGEESDARLKTLVIEAKEEINEYIDQAFKGLRKELNL